MCKWLSPCAIALVVHRNLLYMYESLTYVLTEMKKQNIDVFRTRMYFWKSCELNISKFILKLIAMHHRLLRKDFKTENFHFLNLSHKWNQIYQ